MSVPALVARAVTIAGPHGAIVRDAGLRVEPGRCVGLIGESGSGKTLLLRSLMDLLPEGVGRVGGTIEANGSATLRGDRRRARAAATGTTAMVFQDPLAALDPSMRVGRFIAEVVRGSRSRAGRRLRASELLREVGFVDVERVSRSFPHQLSNGQRQRVVLAIALALEPAILLCDEATSALDTTTQAQIIDLLSSLRSRRDLSMVFVTHDLAVARQICDDMVVLLGGRVLEVGSVEDVLHRPRHPYTVALLEAYRSGADVPARAQRVESACPFAPRCPAATDACSSDMPWVDPVTVRVGSSCRFDGVPRVEWSAS